MGVLETRFTVTCAILSLGITVSAVVFAGDSLYRSPDNTELSSIRQDLPEGARLYHFSPDMKFAAYLRVIRYVKEDGLWEDNEVVPLRPIRNIAIMDMETKTTVSEIPPQSENSTFLSIDGWVSGNELLLHDADQFAVNNLYIYSVREKTLKEIEYEEYEVKMKNIREVKK